MVQLDGLRAIAVFAVLWNHAFPSFTSVLGMDVGVLGVQLFFVLSGFLITGILLDIASAAHNGRDKFAGLGRFYIRRALRIFPLYYAVLFLALLVGMSAIRANWIWHVSYLSNVHYSRAGFTPGDAIHFWSLSVEEQFYLFWPLLILFLPGRFRLPCILLVIVSAPSFRLIADSLFHGPATRLLMPANLDSLGTGALLAYVDRNPFRFSQILPKVLFLVGTLGAVLVYLLPLPSELDNFFLSFILAAVISTAARGFEGNTGRFLGWAPLVYLGRISYGVYILHIFVRAIWWWMLYSAPIPGYRVFPRLGIPASVYESGLVTLIVMIAGTIPLAALSFRYFEGPINDLKRHFPYPRSETPILVADN